MSPTDEIVFDREREVAAIAAALGLPASTVKAAAALLGEGNTIPFEVQYRKDAPGAWTKRSRLRSRMRSRCSVS